MKFYIFILLSFYCLGCVDSDKKHISNAPINLPTKEKNEVDFDSLIAKYFEDKSFKWENGVFVKYFCEGEKLFIEYGNEEFSKILKDTFECLAPFDRFSNPWKYNDDFLLFRFGCGSPCWGVNVLPLNPNDYDQEYMYPYDFDSKNNILIHFDADNSDEDFLLKATNLKTKKTELIETLDCGAAFQGFCIDSISIKNKVVFLQIKTLETDTIGSKIIRKKLSI